MIATFKRTQPKNVLTRYKKSMRPLASGTPRIIKHVDNMIDNADSYIERLASEAAEKLTEEFRSRAKLNPKWQEYADLVSIEFDPESYKFVLTAEDSVIEDVRELERTRDTLFTAFAGEYLSDQDNSKLIVSNINTSSPIGRASYDISKKIKDSLLPNSVSVVNG